MPYSEFWLGGKSKGDLIGYSVVLFTGVMFVSFMIGNAMGVASFFFISFFALAVALLSLLHDNWLLNSIIVPMSFIFSSVSIMDAWDLDLLLLLVHAPTVILSIRVAIRGNVKLSVMIGASIMYGAWVYSMGVWLVLPSYGCVLGICDALGQGIVVVCGCLAISLLVGFKNRKSRGE